jgi:hypothetical protein
MGGIFIAARRRALMLHSLIQGSLVSLAEREFPRLMDHSTNREDALQTIALVQHGLIGRDSGETERAARRHLAWLVYELGLVSDKPRFEKPDFRRPERLTRGTFLRDLAVALDDVRRAS